MKIEQTEIKKVENYLRQAVKSSMVGARLPSIRQIRQACEVGQSVIDRAIENLRNENLVDVRTRSGIFVGKGQAPDIRIFYFHSPDDLEGARLGFFYSVLLHQLFLSLSNGSRRIRLEQCRGLREEEIAMLHQGRPCSILSFGIREQDCRMLNPLHEAGFSILHLLPNFVPPPDHSVIINDDELIRTQLEYLIRRGHRRIGYLHRMNPVSWARAEHMRWAAFHHYALEFGVELHKEYIRHGDFTWNESEPQTEKAAFEIASLPQPPTALLLAADTSARSVYRGIRRAGLEPGRDMALLGVNNSGCCSYFDPSLSSVGFDLDRAFQQIQDLLETLERGRPGFTVTLPIKIFERESTLRYQS